MERYIIDCGYDLEVAHSLKGSLNGKMFYDPEKNVFFISAYVENKKILKSALVQALAKSALYQKHHASSVDFELEGYLPDGSLNYEELNHNLVLEGVTGE